MAASTFFGHGECFGLDRQALLRVRCLQKKSLRALAQKLLGFQIIFSKQRRIKKLCNADTKTLAHLVNNTKLYGVIGAINQISNRRFRDTALDIQLVVGHPPLFQQLNYSFTDSLI